MSPFWHYFVSTITILSLVAFTWFLIATRRGEKHKGLTDETTGHNFDGIEELDNPLPSWWLWLFLLSIAFGGIYLLLYPGLGNYQGLLGWTSVGAWEADQSAAEAKYGAIYNEYLSIPVADLAKDEKAMKMGQRLFSNNCSTCHGSDAQGNVGYPNLTDKIWLYGGNPDQIKTSITYGRQGAMPGWIAAVGEEGVEELVHRVKQMAGMEADAAKAEAGQARYQMFCIACHGTDGGGMHALGAPALNDNEWLYGNSTEAIRYTLTNGRQGIMPAQKELLSEARIHILSAYVYSLSQ